MVLLLTVYALVVSPGDPCVLAAVFAALLLTVPARPPIGWLFVMPEFSAQVEAAVPSCSNRSR